MSTYVEVLVALAAGTFLLNMIITKSLALYNWVIQRSVIQLAQLHGLTAKRISADFELYWESGPKKVVLEKMREKVSDELLIGFSDADFEKSLFVPLMELKNGALHLATHAAMKAEEERILSRLPKIGGVRERVRSERDDLEFNLDVLAGNLLDYGINPNELRDHFILVD